MKTWTMTLASVVALALLADMAMAQPPGGGRGPGQQPGPPGGPQGPGPRGDFRPPRFPLMVALDADEDGELSAQEIENAVAALKKLDKNNDGRLSREELRPEFGPGGPGGPGMFGGPGGGPGRRGPGGGGPGPGGPGQGGLGIAGMVERIMGFDANEDGKVTKEELPEQMQQRMFPRADANGDGAIDRDEAQAVAERIQQRDGQRGEGGRGGRGEGGRGGRREAGQPGEGGERPDRPQRPQGPGN